MQGLFNNGEMLGQFSHDLCVSLINKEYLDVIDGRSVRVAGLTSTEDVTVDRGSTRADVKSCVHISVQQRVIGHVYTQYELKAGCS